MSSQSQFLSSIIKSNLLFMFLIFSSRNDSFEIRSLKSQISSTGFWTVKTFGGKHCNRLCKIICKTRPHKDQTMICFLSVSTWKSLKKLRSNPHSLLIAKRYFLTVFIQGSGIFTPQQTLTFTNPLLVVTSQNQFMGSEIELSSFINLIINYPKLNRNIYFIEYEGWGAGSGPRAVGWRPLDLVENTASLWLETKGYYLPDVILKFNYNFMPHKNLVGGTESSSSHVISQVQKCITILYWIKDVVNVVIQTDDFIENNKLAVANNDRNENLSGFRLFVVSCLHKAEPSNINSQ
ncbi:hypothetical protein AGLY_017258 [Aphis glycines]|uniref:Uncharacterized protein n=1 Tax=Aphis glycines TaxID=307491 RepID=A0A6G0SVE4_APHGL|nr:hypothetical protein AGLY_017258 [Aphis glycines]